MNRENSARAFHKNFGILVALNKSEFMKFDDVNVRKTGVSLCVVCGHFCVQFAISCFCSKQPMLCLIQNSRTNGIIRRWAVYM
jgi:hypothetical protein